MSDCGLFSKTNKFTDLTPSLITVCRWFRQNLLSTGGLFGQLMGEDVAHEMAAVETIIYNRADPFGTYA